MRTRTVALTKARLLALVLLALPAPAFAVTGLAGAWGLNGVSGTEADYSGNNNRGTLNGAISTTAGKFGNALVFNGTNAFVDLGNPTALRLTGSMTVSAWINSAAFPVDDAAIVSKQTGAEVGYQLDTTIDTGPRRIGFRLTNASGGRMYRYGASTLQLNQWYYVSGVYNATAQTMNVYLNGVLDNGTLLGTVTATQKSSPLNVNIGRRAGQAGFEFNGTIDEVRIYNRALSQAEIQADMNAAIAPPAPDTVAPTAPTTLTATAASTSQINLNWTASTDNFDVTGYRVERCQGSGCANFAEIATANALSFNNTGLAPGTSYSYRVRAADGAGKLSGYSGVASATPLGAPPAGGSVGAYPFEEGSGTTTADASGLNNTGTLSGATWTPAGKFGKALVFNGTNAFVNLGNPGTLQLTGSMTVSAWINAAAFPVDDAAIVSKQTGAEVGYQLDTTIDTGPRRIGFRLTNASGGRMYRYGASTLQLNQWYYVSGVYNATAQTMNVYLNGVLDNGTLLGTVTATQQSSPLNVNIGRRAGQAGFEFNGTIDEVRIYNRALSQAEIQADMNTPAGTPAGGDASPPTAPATLTATAASASQINLAWTASTDNVAVTGYRVERCQGAGCSTFTEIATPITTTFSDTNLTAATSYSYRVRASDAANNLSPYSNTASATTAAAAQAQIYYIHPDHLNTPRLIADSTGTTVWRWDQGEPFGNDVPNNNPSGAGAFDFPLRFPGQYSDRETNLAYNNYRDYDSGVGRYVQSDPIGLMGGIGTYTYVRGNPASFVDALGLFITGEWDGFDPSVTDWKYTGVTANLKRKGMVDQYGDVNFLISGILNAKVKCREYTDSCPQKLIREWKESGSVVVNDLHFAVPLTEPVIPIPGIGWAIWADKVLRISQYMAEWRQMIMAAGMALLNSPDNICRGSPFAK